MEEACKVGPDVDYGVEEVGCDEDVVYLENSDQWLS